MKAFLILMVCIAFLTSILTAGRETEWGYKDDGEKKIREQFYSIQFFKLSGIMLLSFFKFMLIIYKPDN